MAKEKSFALKLLAYLTQNYRPDQRRHVLHDVTLTTISPARNSYSHDDLPTIPAGTQIVIDFAGDFGFYGVADIQGVLHKVRVELDQLHFIDWTPVKDQIEAHAANNA